MIKKILCIGLFILCLTNATAQIDNDTIENNDSIEVVLVPPAPPKKLRNEIRYYGTLPFTDLTKAVAGRLAGVRVITETGQPGIASDIIIRGVNSINGSTAPLYVVDGMVYNGDITAINIEYIASLNVLKDINLLLLYGTQAANGVIDIKTKEGFSGILKRPKVDVDVKFGFNFAPQRHEIITDPKTYTELGWLGYYTGSIINGRNHTDAANFASNILFSHYGVNEYYNPFDKEGKFLINPVTGKMFDDVGYRYTPEKWSDYLLRTGKKVETNASISGGNEKFIYYAFFGFIKDEGYYLKSDFQRINALANLEYNPLKWLDITLKVAYNNSVLNNPCQGNNMNNGFSFINGIAPIFPVFMPNTKEYDFGDVHNRNYGWGINPLAALENDLCRTTTDNLLLNNSIKIKLPLGFSIISDIGYNYSNADLNEIINPFYGDAAGIGRQGRTNNVYHHLTARQILRYDNTFKDIHEINIFAGHETILEEFLYSEKASTILFGSEFGVEGSTNMFRKDRFFAGAKYNYNERYFFETNTSFNKSSVFTKENSWFGSWSVGGAWIISREYFMRESKKWLNHLKINLSYGVVGNDNFTFIVFDGSDLKPEKNNIFNAGIEGRIKKFFNIEIDFYDRTISNLFSISYVPPSLGWGSSVRNSGSMKNRGVDFLLSATLVRTGNIQLDVRANANYHFSKMLNLPKEMRWGKEQEMIMCGSIAKGHAIDEWNMPEYACVDKQTGEPLWYAYQNETGDYINDVYHYLNEDNADGELIHKNETLIKTTTNKYYNAAYNYTGKKASPDVFGGFGFDFDCYGFNLSATFAYQIGGYGYDNIYALLMGDQRFGEYAWHKDMLNAWNPITENYNTDVPRMTAGMTYNASYANAGSTRFLTSNSALQLANLTLGYDFPQKYIKRIFLNRLNISVACNNLLIASARKGYNPFTFYSQNNRGQYLQGATLQMGVKVVF